MSRSSVKSLLVQEFINNFDDTIPVNLDNLDKFWLCTSPNLTATTKPSKSVWVRFYISNNESDQITLGSETNRTVRRNGMINFQVFVPQNHGTKDGETVCEDIIDIFELKRISTNIICYEGTYRESGIQEDGSYMLVGNIFYDFDIRK